MSEDAPELVADGAVPPQPVISPDRCQVAYLIAPARAGTAQRRRHLRPHRSRAWPARRAPRRLARRRPDRHHPDRQLTSQAERFGPELLTSARPNGHTWHDLTQALATSPDKAHRRSGPDSR